MKDRSIELMIMFREEEVSPVLLFKYFEELLPRLFKVEFNEIEYSIIVNNKRKGKTLKYKKANIEKCINEITNNPNNGFALNAYLYDVEVYFRDIQLCVSYNSHFHLDGSSSVIVTINEAFYFAHNDTWDLKLFYLQITDYLIKLGKKITYGFIFSLENKKNPILYVVGIGNFDLTKSEENDLFLWSNENDKVDRNIWRVFWGNLITDNHLKAGYSVEKIKKIVGESDFHIVDDHTYFFTLPDNVLAYGLEHEASRKELQKVLNSLT